MTHFVKSEDDATKSILDSNIIFINHLVYVVLDIFK